MITYHQMSLQPFKLVVKLDRKKVGAIFRTSRDGGFYYKPVGANPGPTFDTLDAIKESLA